MAYQGSMKIKGASTAAAATISASNFGRAHFVRVQSQAVANTITLKNNLVLRYRYINISYCWR